MSKYFVGLTDSSIKEALKLSQELKSKGRELHEVTATAGPPKDHFIVYEDGLHPLKATIKKAMELSGIDPSDDSRRGFTSHSARDWLPKLGFSWEQISNPTPSKITDFERHRKLQKILARPEQARFRLEVARLWGYRCPLTQCTAMEAMEAAHIIPIGAGGSDDPSNGILLRADIHKLFDAGLLEFELPELTIVLNGSAAECYRELSNCRLSVPSTLDHARFSENLRVRKSYPPTSHQSTEQ
ncbi:HNH endonuclease [Aliiroseovarius sediminis]|uniref:HNH endonuclease n=1 Tax=Aliiroseovarius sediminis TaxID=2925839 RepID=UPI001F589A61|nr:HNH endonuclease [Aliiroseovarius sediminis]MCI2394372.1 HNH endonuclease [Aliiroseovarius sediminis]